MYSTNYRCVYLLEALPDLLSMSPKRRQRAISTDRTALWCVSIEGHRATLYREYYEYKNMQFSGVLRVRKKMKRVNRHTRTRSNRKENCYFVFRVACASSCSLVHLRTRSSCDWSNYTNPPLRRPRPRPRRASVLCTSEHHRWRGCARERAGE